MHRVFIRSAAVAVVMVLTTASSIAHADPPSAISRNVEAIDVETTEESIPNRGLILGGAFVLGVTYGSSAIVGATSDDGSDRALFVPLAGPWIDLADRDASGNRESTYKVLLVADGIGQGVGALQIVGGFLFPAKRTVTRIAEPEVHFLPTVGQGEAGARAAGRF